MENLSFLTIVYILFNVLHCLFTMTEITTMAMKVGSIFKLHIFWYILMIVFLPATLIHFIIQLVWISPIMYALNNFLGFDITWNGKYKKYIWQTFKKI